MGSETVWGSADYHERKMWQAPNRRRKCRCGCGGRATHVGGANGVALMSGCELTVRRWVKDQDQALRARLVLGGKHG